MESVSLNISWWRIKSHFRVIVLDNVIIIITTTTHCNGWVCQVLFEKHTYTHVILCFLAVMCFYIKCVSSTTRDWNWKYWSALKVLAPLKNTSYFYSTPTAVLQYYNCIICLIKPVHQKTSIKSVKAGKNKKKLTSLDLLCPRVAWPPAYYPTLASSHCSQYLIEVNTT